MLTKNMKQRTEDKMNNPAVRQAIRTLKAKGVTIQEIEKAYRYYDGLGKKKEQTNFLDSIL